MKAFFRVVAACAVAALSVVPAPARCQDKTVSISYVPVTAPWLFALGSGAFSRETGYTISWFPYETGAGAMDALHQGKVQIAYSGSTQITVVMSKGAEKELFWIAKETDITEGLVVHTRSWIEEPRKLRGKQIAAPFWSTHHFHLLFALEQFNLTENNVDIYDMRPSEILAAWNAGGLDAAYIGTPTLDRLLSSGRVLVWSGWLNRWGKPTFDGFVVRRDWSMANPEFMRGFVKVLDAVNRNYAANADRWTSDSREIQTIVKFLGPHSNVVTSLKMIKIPPLEEQLSIAWLGGGGVGGAAKTLRATAQYLDRFGMVEKVLPDYSPYITDRWAKAALQARQEDAAGAPRR